jgi:hypothetical protein
MVQDISRVWLSDLASQFRSLSTDVGNLIKSNDQESNLNLYFFVANSIVSVNNKLQEKVNPVFVSNIRNIESVNLQALKNQLYSFAEVLSCDYESYEERKRVFSSFTHCLNQLASFIEGKTDA